MRESGFLRDGFRRLTAGARALAPAAALGVVARAGAGARVAVVAAAAAAAAAACLPAAAADAAAAPPHIVLDPHYGDSLFYFYQGRYFTSVTNLMVSQHFERVAHHADEAEVLRGGLFLSYGMHREAGEIFAQLIEKGAPPPVRDRAWYFLAKIRYQRGDLPGATDALARITNHLPPDLEEERELLQANVLMARGDFTAAAQVLGALAGAPGSARGATPGSPPGGNVYARYNLGVALIKSGDAARGGALLDELGQIPATTEELRSLRDRANVALGYAALQDNHPERARVVLERVRLNGMLASNALLGFGWAAAALQKPDEALVPWTELAARDPGDAAVLEARLAVPYAFAQLGAYGQSLQHYTDAIVAFDEEDVHLDESVAAIRSGKLLAGLMARNPGEEMGWFWTIDRLPQMPHAAHLSQVLAEHAFQEAFKNYRDLQFLARNLRNWEDKLGVFGDMLAQRREAFAQRLPQVRARDRALGIEALTQRAGEVAREFDRVEAQQDGTAFADARERDLQVRLDRVRAQLARGGPELGADADVGAAAERLRRAAGALTWELSQAFPARLWEASKGLKDIEVGLADAQRRDAALARAQLDEPVRFEQFAARITALGARVRVLMPRVDQLALEQQHEVQELAVAVLTRQKERLTQYASQARFAVAQLYDRAHVAKEGGNAPAQK
jgi:tetratricopeptide (TPR) repeat protein